MWLSPTTAPDTVSHRNICSHHLHSCFITSNASTSPIQYIRIQWNIGRDRGREGERERANLKESNGRLNMLRVQLKYATPDRKWQCLPMPTDELLPEYAGDDVGLWSWCWCCCCYWWWWCWANDVHSLKHSLVSPTHTHTHTHTDSVPFPLNVNLCLGWIVRLILECILKFY